MAAWASLLPDLFAVFGEGGRDGTMTFRQFVNMIRVAVQWRDGGEPPTLQEGLKLAQLVREAKGGVLDTAFKRCAELAFVERCTTAQLESAVELGVFDVIDLGVLDFLMAVSAQDEDDIEDDIDEKREQDHAVHSGMVEAKGAASESARENLRSQGRRSGLTSEMHSGLRNVRHIPNGADTGIGWGKQEAREVEDERYPAIVSSGCGIIDSYNHDHHDHGHNVKLEESENKQYQEQEGGGGAGEYGDSCGGDDDDVDDDMGLGSVHKDSTVFLPERNGPSVECALVAGGHSPSWRTSRSQTPTAMTGVAVGLCGDAQASPKVGFVSSGTRGWSPRVNRPSEVNNGTGQSVHGSGRVEVGHKGSLAVATSSHSAASLVSRESNAFVSTTDYMMDAEMANSTLLESKNEGVCDVISTHDSMVD